MINVTVRVEFKSDRIGEIIERYPVAVQEIVSKTTYDCLEAAQTMVPVDTGALRASIQAEVTGYQGIVSTGMDYAWFVEDGTIKMAAQPYMRPAALTVEQPFFEEMDKLHRSL